MFHNVNISQNVYCIWNQIYAALLSIRNLFLKTFKNLTVPNLKKCVFSDMYVYVNVC